MARTSPSRPKGRATTPTAARAPPTWPRSRRERPVVGLGDHRQVARRCGALQPGYTVSEMSVQHNEYLDQYVVTYGDQFNNIIIRTFDRPEGTWSSPTVLIGQQTGGIYAPMMHPW